MRHAVFALTAILSVGRLVMAGGPGTPDMDGFLDTAYGDDPVATQDTQTEFGDSNLGQIEFANGSELDACWATIDGETLYLLFAGNIESNFNKLEVFFDFAGGQNRLRGDNPEVDVVPGLDSGLNRMGDDGSGNGLIFDAGFEADYYVTATCGDSAPFRFELRYAEILTGGGGEGGLAGVVNGGGAGNVIVGDNGILAALDNTNALGVTFGCGPDDGSGVPTGVELGIPLSLLGDGASNIRICSFINGVLHDFMSNQVLAPLSGACNLGEPRNVDFGAIPGDQFFVIAGSGGPCAGDVDGSGDVGFADLLEVLSAWGPCAGCIQDLDGDDMVGFSDLLIVLGGWGPCP